MTRYSFLILLVFSIVSCLPQSQQETPLVCLAEGAHRALFEVDKIEYKFEPLPDPSESILDSNFLVDFTACIKDAVKEEPMKNHSFGIHTFRDEKEPEETIKDTLCENVEWGCIPVDTDNNGCITWGESHSFALPAEQKWIGFKRAITHRTGIKVIPMAINPWLPVGSKVVDLRFRDEASLLAEGRSIFYLHEQINDEHKLEKSPIQECKEEGSLDQAFSYLGEKEKKAFLWVNKVTFDPSRKVHPNNPDYKKIYKICDESLSLEECDQSCDDDSLSDEGCEQNRKLDRKGGFLDLNLKIYVDITSEDESGRIDYKPVPTESEFEVTFYLISEPDETNNGKYYMLHRPVESVETTAGKEYIHLDNTLLHIPYDTIKGTSILLLQVKSLGAEDMEPFYGVYKINKSIRALHDTPIDLSLKSSKLASSKQRGGFSKVESYRKRIKEYKEMFDVFHKDDNAYTVHKPKVGKDGFDYFEGLALSLFRMRFARVKASGDSSTCESPVKRWVVYLGEVCLRDPVIKQNFEKKPVTVTAQDMWMSRNSEGRIIVRWDDEKLPEKIVDDMQADNNGCIQFTYELDHKLYDVQKYFMKKLTFRVGDLEESEYVALNPWEYGFLTYQKFTQAYKNWYAVHKKYNECKSQDRPKDCPNIKQAEDGLEDRLEDFELRLAGPLFSENVEPPVLRLNEYRSVIIEPSYNVEPSLDVQIVKNLQMLLQPTIVRQDSPGEGIRQIPRILPIGYYLIRFIIAKGPQETAEGQRLIMDRFSLDPLQSGLRLFDSVSVFNRVFNMRKIFGRIAHNIQIPMNNRRVEHSRNAIDELEIYTQELEDVRDELQELSQNSEYEKYEELLKELESLRKTNATLEPLRQKLEDAHNKYLNLYDNIDYEAYGERFKTANAKEFSGDGCQKGDRLPCFKSGDYIDHFDTLAKSENGVLSVFVKFDFNVEHFRHLASKNSILIQIYPTDPSEYRYVNAEETEGNNCVLDIDNTTFKPFPTCVDKESGNDNDNCHELKIPAHWGLFFNTEFGMVNITWPTTQDFTKVFSQHIKNPIEIDGEFYRQLKEEAEELGKMENAIDYVRGIPENNKVDVDRPYDAHFKNFVTNMDRVNVDEFIQYCENIKKQIADIESSDLIGDENSLLEELFLVDLVCYESMQDSSTSISGRKLKQQIRKYFTYRDFHEVRARGKNPMEEFRVVQSQEGSFCDEKVHKATAFGIDENDWTESAVSYRNCVCSPPNEEFITSKMARCFAKSQGLVFVEDNMDFLDRLKGSVFRINQDFEFSEDNLAQVVNQSGIKNPIFPKDFLQSMCHLWFTEYYKNYLSLDHVRDIYNKSVSNLEFLYNNSYMEVPEENQLENLDFDTFKDILNSPNGMAQWFHAAYFNKNYEPFEDYKKTSDTDHPFYTCFRDPLQFFHLERKVIVGELDTESDRTWYKSGRFYSLSVQASQGAQTRVEQSKKQQISSSVRGDARAEIPIIKRILIKTTFAGGISADASRAGTVSASEQNATDSSKSVPLGISHVQMDLALKKHRSCLLIRPKGNAFEEVPNTYWKKDLQKTETFWASNISEDAISWKRLPYTNAGLLICDEESSDPLEISENYYYVHQYFGGHSYEFMSRTIYHNRPYTEIIRGREQMNKFIRSIQDVTYNRESRMADPFKMKNLIKHLDMDRTQLDLNLIQAFEQNALDWSGFYQGIYTYPDLISYYSSDMGEDPGLFDRVMDKAGNMIVVPAESIYDQ